MSLCSSANKQVVRPKWGRKQAHPTHALRLNLAWVCDGNAQEEGHCSTLQPEHPSDASEPPSAGSAPSTTPCPPKPLLAWHVVQRITPVMLLLIETDMHAVWQPMCVGRWVVGNVLVNGSLCVYCRGCLCVFGWQTVLYCWYAVFYCNSRCCMCLRHLSLGAIPSHLILILISRSAILGSCSICCFYPWLVFVHLCHWKLYCTHPTNNLCHRLFASSNIFQFI